MFTLVINAQLATTVVATSTAFWCLANGSAQVTTIGGTAPYLYSLVQISTAISNQQSSTFFSNLAPGLYKIITTDATNQTTSVVFSILTTPPITTSISLASSSNSVYVTAIGGTPPYQYSVDNGQLQGSNFFNNLLIGNHIFTVKDISGCLVNATYQIVANALSSSLSLTNSSCFGSNDGKIIVNATGGVPPYSFKINTGAIQTSNIFTNLATGIYEVTVFDSANFANSTPIVSILQPTQLISNTTITNNDITVNATGGTPPYKYGVNSGLLQSSNTFTNLPIGNYNVQTKDNNGCFYNIIAVVNVAPPLFNNQQAASVNFPTSGSTLADIVVQGNNILWYANQGTGNLLNRSKRSPLETQLPLTTILKNNTTYYASQTLNGFESQKRLAITVTIGALSTNDNVFEGFKYYPNPVKNTFAVSTNLFEIQELNVVDLSGKTLISNLVNDFKSEIDFSKLSKGMYFVKIKSFGNEKIIKVFKE